MNLALDASTFHRQYLEYSVNWTRHRYRMPLIHYTRYPVYSKTNDLMNENYKIRLSISYVLPTYVGNIMPGF